MEDLDFTQLDAAAQAAACERLGKHLRRRFRLSLLLIVGLLTVTFTGLSLFIYQQSISAKRIQLTMQQRELSQQITALTNQLVATDNIDARKNILQAIQQTTLSLQQTHAAVMKSPALISGMSSLEKKVYYHAPHKLDQRIKDFVAAVTRLENEDPASINEETPSVEVITTEGPGHLLHSLSGAIEAHESSVTAAMKTLLIAMGLLWFGLIALFVLQGIYVFRPIYASIHRVMGPLLKGAQQSSDNYRLEEEMRKHFKRESEQHKTLLNHIENVIFAIDTNGIIKTYNQMAEKLLGFLPADVIGKKSVTALHDPEDLAKRAQQLSTEYNQDCPAGLETITMKAKQGESDQYAWRLRTKVGDAITMTLNYRAILNDNNEICGYFAMGCAD